MKEALEILFYLQCYYCLCVCVWCVLFFNEAAVANRNMNNILLYTFKNNGLSQY